ncbi:MAG: hypothetical protein SFU25_12040 [Candidatus Caenarcaniphilales bacterium]|nr:hypothetical protein [Candidatus Caenarcaniphilales bacterium]
MGINQNFVANMEYIARKTKRAAGIRKRPFGRSGSAGVKEETVWEITRSDGLVFYKRPGEFIKWLRAKDALNQKVVKI